MLRDTEFLRTEVIRAARHHLYGVRSGGLRALKQGFMGEDRQHETAAARLKEEQQLEGRDDNCYYFPALQLFSPAEVALRLRGRELVEPAEAWAHFYPEALSEGTSIMGVPSSDEVERTSGWLRQKVLNAEIEWVRELLRFGTGRATLRAFDEPANSYEDDKDHVKVQIYRDLKKEVDLHKDIPTASTCARTILLPVFAKEEHFLQKLDTALQEFRVQQNQRGGAEFSYE